MRERIGRDLENRVALAREGLATLVRLTQSGPTRFRMSGPLRAIAYRTAAFTGLHSRRTTLAHPRVVPP